MRFETLGDAKNPAVLFFHAMGVTGQSGERVAEFLKDDYFCIMPTSTVYCAGQKYISKEDEIRQIEDHFKYRDAVMQAYPHGNFPVFEGHDHMQHQIRDPKGFAEMLCYIAEHDRMPELKFIRK